MKHILLTAMVLATITTPVFARGHLYADYNGNYGWCVNEEGVPDCTFDWMGGQ